MLSVREAQERIITKFAPVGQETCDIDQASGRVLASEVCSPYDHPLFDNSSVDGFAVCAAESAHGQTLIVVTDIRAGDVPAVEIKSGQAARIMTGAVMPAGADAVIMVEDTDFFDRSAGVPAPEKVTLRKSVEHGENIRYRGEDFRAGEKLFAPGIRLRSADIGLLAMLGIARIPVNRKPVMALLSSGDELLPVDIPLAPGKIHDTNSHTLHSLAQNANAHVIPLGIARDDEGDIRSRLDLAVENHADLIITSAGVSVGAFDYIKSVVEKEGKLDFWRVNIRPGKPLAFGEYRGIPIFGLPGNPVSAYIGFEVFVRPALDRLSGLLGERRRDQLVQLAETIESDGRESYLRAVVTYENGTAMARLTGHQGSGNIHSLVRANALLIVPSGVKCVPAGTEMTAWLLE